LLDLGKHLAIWNAPVDLLREARKNARSMDNRLLGLLTETITKDQRLESLPLTTWSRTAGGNEELLIISGHHRIRAARAAGIKEIHVLVDERKLTHAEITAKQLAHNAVEGRDDESLLSQLLAEIDSAELRRLSGVNLQDFKNETERLPDIAGPLHYETVAIYFLPAQKLLWEEALKSFPAADEHLVARMEDFAAFKAALDAIHDAANVRNVAAQLSVFSRIILEHYNGIP